MLKIGLAFTGNDGAYQMGVWRALKQEGVESYITAVAGASVGGIIAALFLQGDDGVAEHIWKNAAGQRLTSEEIEGIVDTYLDLKIFDTKSCYLAYSPQKHEALYWNLKGVALEERREKLLDESAEEIVPVKPLYLQEKCDVIVAVHPKLPIDAVNFSKFRNAQIIEIVPEDTDGAFDAKKRMEQGYNDSLHIFARIKKELDEEIESLLCVESADDRKKIYQKIKVEKGKGNVLNRNRE